MGLFSTYKGYDIVKDESTGKFIIRTAGPYGVKVGEAVSEKEARRLIKGLKKW